MAESCYFCDRPAVAQCSWRTGSEAFVPVDVGSLVVGDKVQRLLFRGDSFALVLSIREFEGYRDYQLVIPARRGGKTRLKLWSARNYERVKAFRVASCAVACCENHHREPCEGTAYCANCWRLQEAAA